MSDEPNISDAECDALTKALRIPLVMGDRIWNEFVRQALAAFLAARVPDALDPEVEKHKADGFTPREVSLVCMVHNACREAVLNGRTDGK